MFIVPEQQVGAAVRSAREAKGLSLRAVAGLLDVSPATLSGIKNDRTPLTVERLQRIAELVDVPPSRLLRGEITVPPTPAGMPTPGKGSWRRFDDLRLDPVAQAGKEAGKPIVLKDYVRFQLGEGIEKEESDFAAEVAAAVKG